MSNVVAFKSAENFSTVTFRSNQWELDTDALLSLRARYPVTGQYNDITEFKVTANHDKGSEPFESVNLEVFVAGRQSNEHFELTRKDAIALRDMFAQVAATMRD